MSSETCKKAKMRALARTMRHIIPVSANASHDELIPAGCFRDAGKHVVKGGSSAGNQRSITPEPLDLALFREEGKVLRKNKE